MLLGHGGVTLIERAVSLQGERVSLYLLILSPQKDMKIAKKTVAPLSNTRMRGAKRQALFKYQKSHFSSQRGHM